MFDKSNFGQLTSGVFLCIASIFGIPISLAEIITSGIIGFSCANSGFSSND